MKATVPLKFQRRKIYFTFKIELYVWGDIFLTLWKTILYFKLRAQARKNLFTK